MCHHIAQNIDSTTVKAKKLVGNKSEDRDAM